MQTAKLGLCLAVAPSAMAAPGASLRGVVRVHGHDRDADQPSLVLDKVPELREGPVAEAATIPARNGVLDPGPNMGQVFQGESLIECLGGSDELLGDFVIDVGLKPGLTSADALELAFGGLRSFPLVLLAARGAAAPVPVDGGAAVGVALAVHRDVDDAEVNAQECLDRAGRRFGQFHRGQQVELAVAVDQVALALDAVETLALVLAVDQSDNLTARERGQADAVDALEAHVPLIVGHGAVRPEHRADRLVAAEALHGLADGAHGELCGQVELLADGAVAEPMDARLAEYARGKTLGSGEGRGLVHAAHGVEQQRGLLGRRQQLELDSQLHACIIRNESFRMQVGSTDCPK